MVDDAILGDPARLAAVHRARRALPAQPIPLTAIARLAARLLHAPMASVTLVGRDEGFFAGSHGLPQSLTTDGRAPIEYSVCKYIVIQDHLVVCEDMLHDDISDLREHPLVTEYGVRSFLGVPVRDDADRLLGSMTVLDTTTRQWTDDDLTTLLEIAELLRPPAPVEAADQVASLDSAALLDSVQEAVLAVDSDGTVVGFNRAAEDLLGFSRAEVCGRHLDDSLLPGYDGQPIGAALERLFAAGPRRPVLRRVSVQRRDGHRLTVAASLSVVHGAAGALACAFLTDLTQQIAAEKQQAAAEEQQAAAEELRAAAEEQQAAAEELRAAAEERADHDSSFLIALLDSLSVGVLACDEAGQVVLMNRVLREIQGVPLTAAVPADYPALVRDVLHDARMRRLPWEDVPLMRALRGESVDGFDVVTAAPGEPVRTFATTARPMIAGDGRLLGAVAVAHELTAIRRAERFRACHLAVEDALRAADSETDAAAAVLETVGTALGWPYAELFLINEGTGQLHPAGQWDASGDDPDGFLGDTPVHGAGVTGRVWRSGRAMWVADIAADTELNTPYEQARVQAWLRHGIHTVLAVPVRDGGTLLGVLTCYADAPEQHEQLLTVLLDGVAAQFGVYVALRRAEQLTRQLARAQDDLIALVGHEMRTPLTSIAANVTMLDEEAGFLDEDHRQMLHSVTRNTAALQRVVDKLLDLAGLDSGHLGLAIGEVDLAAIVAEAVAGARRSAADTGVLLRTDLPARVLLDGDARRLRQVVDDLLSNAVKYSPLGGEVRIELIAGGSMAELCISDTGIGTPAEERDRVFDRFFRGSNVRHQGTTGSGLGLSLARTIVRMHGGTIQLTANQPSGTAVHVRLPRAEAGRPEA
ncbi:ATP-binding protein [Actinoplanes sp. GCM10030250]|uniref:ATP-binding protein n=1 Tax=Actinoplanes sp. GCM10030250 TaxID=3273376 RepID=UPI0036167589